jgi:hypothetical protein
MAAEGTRRIRHSPELRFYVGFYYQNKIGHHDEKEKLMALFQLSTIDPLERDSLRFLPQGSKDVNLIEFKDFSARHPRLVRRLRDLVVDTDNAPKKHEKPEDVVRFLADNHDVPSLFLEEKAGMLTAGQKETPKKEERERFPVLPPKHTPPPPQRLYMADELDSTRSLSDDVDPFVVARAWYCYAQEPVPDPDDIPGSTKDPENRILQHRPKGMSTLLFRNYPPRAQSYIAERLGMEGWLDLKHGWNLVEAFPQLRSLNLNREEAEVGDKQAVKTAWEKAAVMWEEHGRRNHVLVAPAEEKEKREMAAEYKEIVEIDPNSPAGQNRLRALQGNLAQAYQAARFVQQYDYYRQLTNFPHFLIQANVEKQDEAINGRMLFFEADEPKLRPQRHLRLKKYGEGLEVWKELFRKNPDFRADSAAQEEAYEWELRYLALFQELPDQGQVIKKALVVEDLLGLIAARPDAALDRLLTVGELENLQLLPAPYIPGPLDVLDEDKKPYIPKSAEETVASRVAGLVKSAGRQLRPENPVTPPTGTPGAAPDTPAELRARQ